MKAKLQAIWDAISEKLEKSNYDRFTSRDATFLTLIRKIINQKCSNMKSNSQIVIESPIWDIMYDTKGETSFTEKILTWITDDFTWALDHYPPEDCYHTEKPQLFHFIDKTIIIEDWAKGWFCIIKEEAKFTTQFTIKIVCVGSQVPTCLNNSIINNNRVLEINPGSKKLDINCPVCSKYMNPEDIYICNNCNAYYHTDCANYVGSCARFGCTEIFQ